jgi:hypothetical protein
MIGLPHLLWSDGHPKISGFEAYDCDTKRLHMEVRCDHGSDWRIDFLACISAGNTNQENDSKRKASTRS